MRISDWSSDVCSSDLKNRRPKALPEAVAQKRPSAVPRKPTGPKHRHLVPAVPVQRHRNVPRMAFRAVPEARYRCVPVFVEAHAENANIRASLCSSLPAAQIIKPNPTCFRSEEGRVWQEG